MTFNVPRAVQTLHAARSGLRSLLAEYAENERRSFEVLAALQVEKVRLLLAHAQQRVPFWQRRLAALGLDPARVRSIDDLAKLPPLEKEDLQERGTELLAGGRVDPTWQRNSSGGSSGLDVSFYQDRRYQRRMLADQLRHLTWMGLDWRATRGYVWGAERDSREHEGLKGRLKDSLRGVVWLNSFRARDDDYRAFARRCARAKPDLLIGYASSLEHFARVLEADAKAWGRGGERSLAPWQPKAIQSSAEQLTSETRARLERVFHCPVFDRYESREMGTAAHECEAHDGLHVSMERVVIEVVRENTPVEDGVDGELLVTVLDNFAMPLIRYRVGDIGCKLPAEPCSCGRPYERFLITDGRVADLITSPRGHRIHGEYFTHLFDGIEGISAFQVVQETRERLVLQIVRSPQWREGALARVLDGIREIDPGFKVEVRPVPEIAPPASGKRRFTASQVPIEW